MRTSFLSNDTICAVASTPGVGAIAVIRVSGPEAHDLTCKLFHRQGKPFPKAEIRARKAYFGQIVMADDEVLDDVLVTFFQAPHSFTGEDSVEISTHGSVFIQQKLLELLIELGARMALPGEFTRRAFVNRKFDLAQAEAVADLIASQNEADHRIAIHQLKGGFSAKLQELRSKLLDITALMELELDFSEEDVEFADRTQLRALLAEAQQHIQALTASFRWGNAIKNGIPVAIVGETNTGKSTLLNALLGEERAIVSDIAGTTRDTIEEAMNLDGTRYRFIDTAGIRDTEETIEKIGIERTYRKLGEADIVLGMIDANQKLDDIVEKCLFIHQKMDQEQQNLVILLNKTDLCQPTSVAEIMAALGQDPTLTPGLATGHIRLLAISAKTGEGMEALLGALRDIRQAMTVQYDAVMVSNVRHFEALKHAAESLDTVQRGLEDGIPTDLVAQDLREALYHLGTITGEITTDEVLGAIFGRFCIGK